MGEVPRPLAVLSGHQRSAATVLFKCDLSRSEDMTYLRELTLMGNGAGPRASEKLP